MKHFIKIQKNNIIYYTTKDYIDNNILYAFCAKSSNEFLNFSTRRNTPKEIMQKSYMDLCSALSIDYKKVIQSNANHGNIVYKAEEKDYGKGIYQDTLLPFCDGIMTNKANLPISTNHADCLPISFYDNRNHAILLLHCGWKGVLNNATGDSIKAMIKTYSTDPKNLICAVGPGIMQCCFEVDETLRDEFVNKLGNNSFVSIKDNKFFIDLYSIVIKQMEDYNINPANLTIAKECTCHNNLDFHSYRRDKNEAGTMTQIMMLN